MHISEYILYHLS